MELSEKSTVHEIQQRFDGVVDCFSSLEQGARPIADERLMMELVAQVVARRHKPGPGRHLLDVGCGAGNFALIVLQQLPGVSVTLQDLSTPMVDRAVQRVSAATDGRVTGIQGDIREVDLGHQQFDVIVAGFVLHHLRESDQWRNVYRKLFESLKPGGSLWVVDLVSHDDADAHAVIQDCYGDYLSARKDEAFRDLVLGLIEKEDSPRSLLFQIDLMRQTGFEHVEILHKQMCYATFGSIKTL